MRLNKGVRGRLMDKAKYLMKEKKIDGFDVNYIYEHTKELKNEEGKRHEFNEVC